MDAPEIIAQIRARGGTLTRRSGQLLVGPPEIAALFAEFIKSNRAAIWEALRQERLAPLLARLEAGRCADCDYPLNLTDRERAVWWCPGCRVFWGRQPEPTGQPASTGWLSLGGQWGQASGLSNTGRVFPFGEDEETSAPKPVSAPTRPVSKGKIRLPSGPGLFVQGGAA